MLYFSTRYPGQTEMTALDVYRINRIKIAKYFGITPGAVDDMSEQDYLDTLEVMWAEDMLKTLEQELAQAR